jgi:hypothetical protein
MEFEKQIDGAPKNGDLLERWAQGNSGRVQRDGTPIKNGDLLERWVQGDNGQVQPDGTPVGISPTRLSDETEQKQKRPLIRLILALVTTIVCIGGSFWIGSARDASSPTGSLSRPMERSSAASEIIGSMPTRQSRGNVTAGVQTSSDAMPDGATAGASGRLTRSNGSQPGRPQPPRAMSSAEEAKLVARAESLIKQFDFASARLLLAHALEKGSARAAFMMAETYDWQILRSLQAYGVRGDAQRAREFYQLAAAAGIEKAQERVEALQSGANFDTRVGGENRSR